MICSPLRASQPRWAHEQRIGAPSSLCAYTTHLSPTSAPLATTLSAVRPGSACHNACHSSQSVPPATLQATTAVGKGEATEPASFACAATSAMACQAAKTATSVSTTPCCASLLGLRTLMQGRSRASPFPQLRPQNWRVRSWPTPSTASWHPILWSRHASRAWSPCRCVRAVGHWWQRNWQDNGARTGAYCTRKALLLPLVFQACCLVAHPCPRAELVV